MQSISQIYIAVANSFATCAKKHFLVQKKEYFKSKFVQDFLTAFVGEDRWTDTARPHTQCGRESRGRRRRQLPRVLRVAGDVLAQAALVHVKLSAHRTRVVGASALG